MKITRCLLVCLALSLASIANADAVRTVAITGDESPGIDGNFSRFRSGTPVINNVGQVAFTAILIDSEMNDSNGIWSEGNGSLALVARAGEGAPGTSVNFSTYTSPIINESGKQRSQEA